MKKDIELMVMRNCALTDFLTAELSGLSKKEIKALLTHKSVIVSGKIITKYDYPLKKGQKVLIDRNNKTEFLKSKGLRIIYEDDDIIAVNKPPGLLTVAIEDKSFDTVFTLMNEYVKLSDKRNRIYIVHRLDRDTSGVIVVAKSEEFKNLLQNNWNILALSRKYYAVTEGIPTQKSGIIRQNLTQNKALKMYNAGENGAVAVTEYSVIKEGKDYSLLDVAIKTGKKNQIRVALSSIGHNIAGDKKYGAKTNPLKRLGLHAYKLELKNPETGEIYSFEAKMPKEFASLFKER